MKKSFALIAALVLSTGAFAGEDGQADNRITVAADSSSGTYVKMLNEVVARCDSDKLNITQAKNGGGAPGNLDALVNNQAQAAFLHSDVYQFNAQADSQYAKFQTLVALYPEPIHVIVLRDSGLTAGGHLGFGSSAVVFNNLGDLKGYIVGAAGGGVYTAKILTGQGQGGFQVVAYNKGDEVIAALQNHQIQAAIFVGAAPLPNLAALPRGVYKLIPIGEVIGAQVSGVYRPTTINYASNGMTVGPVKTLAPVATLLTRKYSTPTKVNAQIEFRRCFYAHLDELKDEGAPNWQQVDAGDQGVIKWLELPSAPLPIKK